MNRDDDALLVKAPSLVGLCRPLPHAMASSSGTVGASVDLPALASALSEMHLESLLPPSMQHAVRRRQTAWIGGRLCAERSLALLGIAGRGVPRGSGGEPLWPRGVAGSISHTDTTAYAAAVARPDAAGIGIDSEPTVGPDTQRAVVDICCTPTERTAWLMAPDSRIRATLLFASKEAFYKAAWPALGRFIDFEEVEACAWNTRTKTIGFRAASTLPIAGFEAHYRLEEAKNMVHVSVWLSQAAVASLAEARGSAS